jgi:hypothetical protein
MLLISIYLGYDLEKDFLPQFTNNSSTAISFLKTIVSDEEEKQNLDYIQKEQ